MNTENNLVATELDLKIALIKAYAKNKDILSWGELLFPHKFPLPFCYPLHNYFVDIRMEKQTVTEAPRAHSKTTIKCSLIPLFQALEEPEYFQHYLNVQNTTAKAISVNNGIRNEIENNEVLRLVYGDQVSREKWTEKQFELNNGVVFTAIGSGESMRGIQHKNKRPDYVIIDDLYDDEDIYSQDRIEKKEAWFWSSLYPALANHKQTCLHIQGTAIHRKDLMMSLSDNVDWKYKSFKTIIDYEKKEVLWKELKSFDEWMKTKKTMPILAFNREYQNERGSDEDSWFPLSKILKCYDNEATFVDDNSGLETFKIVIGVDLAISSMGDYFIIFVIGVDKLGNHWVLNIFRERGLSFNSQLEMIINYCNRFKPIACLVEDNAYQKVMSQTLIERTDCPVKGFTTNRNKNSEEIGIKSLSLLIENNKLKIPRGDEQSVKLTDLFVRELTDYGKIEHTGDMVMAWWFCETGLKTFLREAYITKGIN